MNNDVTVVPQHTRYCEFKHWLEGMGVQLSPSMDLVAMALLNTRRGAGKSFLINLLYHFDQKDQREYIEGEYPWQQ